MSLGLPNFNFIFQSKGISAIERSARGIVAVILNDDTEGEEQNVYNKVDDVDFTQWTEDNYNYLKYRPPRANRPRSLGASTHRSTSLAGVASPLA